MLQSFTLEYWMDGDWYVGRLRGVPGVFSQGQSMAELEDNVRDAYRMMIEEVRDSLGQLIRKQLGIGR
jgi:predicted RNase H-like HicB family nuclease